MKSWNQPDVVLALLSDIRLFSRHIIGLPLYDYQVNALRPIIESVLARDGREHLLVFPRQSGKNEAVAQLLVYLLNLLQKQEGNIVYAAIGDGIGRGMQRLEERLENRWNAGRWRTEYRPNRRVLGKAAVTFLSSHPKASARGETAHHLLIVDEFQDNDLHHIETVFTPMRAAYNAAALYLGTVRTTSDALWQKRNQLLDDEQADDLKRVHIIGPDIVTADNPYYRNFLANQVDRYGQQHPIVASEYYLQPIDSAAALFPPARLNLMRGNYPRQLGPSNASYIATIDVAGQDEQATDILAALANPGRDYTVATIFRIDYDDNNRPVYNAVDVFVDQGSRHFQSVPGKAMLAERLLSFLEHWQVLHTIIDAGGVGEGLADWLAARISGSDITPIRLDRYRKAKLGNTLLSLIETGRLHYWTDDQDSPLTDGWWLWKQAAACTYHLPPGGLFDRDLRFSVPASHTTTTPIGTMPTHDDRLMSLLLVAHAEELVAAAKLRTGMAKSVIIPPTDRSKT